MVVMGCGCSPGTSSIFCWWTYPGGSALPNQAEPEVIDQYNRDLAWIWQQPAFPNPPCSSPLPVTVYFERIRGPYGTLSAQKAGFHVSGDCSGLKAKAVTLVANTDTFSTPAVTVTQVGLKFCEPGVYKVWVERLTCGAGLFASADIKTVSRRLLVEVF